MREIIVSRALRVYIDLSSKKMQFTLSRSPISSTVLLISEVNFALPSIDLSVTSFYTAKLIWNGSDSMRMLGLVS